MLFPFLKWDIRLTTSEDTHCYFRYSLSDPFKRNSSSAVCHYLELVNSKFPFKTFFDCTRKLLSICQIIGKITLLTRIASLCS